MNKPNVILRAAVAACFGIAAGQAAAIVDTANTDNAVKVAKELVKTTTTLTEASDILALKVAIPNGYVTDASNPLYIKLNLTGGASFASTPNMICATGAASASVDDMSGDVTLGGNGTAAVTFLASANGATMASACYISGFDLTIPSGGASTNITVSATVEYKNGLNNVVTGVSTNYVTFTRGIGALFSGASGSVVVDATSGSDNFASAGSTSVTDSANMANVGFVTFNSGVGAATAVNTATMNAANQLTAGIVIQSATITVSGPAIPVAMGAVAGSGVFLSLSGDAACSTKTYKPASSGSTSVTFTGVSVANIQDGLHVCVTVSGNTSQIPTGQITATIDGTAVTNVTADFSATSNNLENISQNGTTKNAYFVNASTSTNKTSVIRIVNTGGNSGTIRATAYLLSNDGTPVGTAAGTANSTIATLAANESISLSSSQLETLLSLTPASSTSKYRVVFSAGLAGFKILNYTKDVATGNLTLSQAQDD